MSISPTLPHVAALAALAALTAFSASLPAHAEPLTGASPHQSTEYHSAMDGYRPLKAMSNPPTLETWRHANRTVAEVGGHAGVYQAMQAAESKAARTDAGQPQVSGQPADPAQSSTGQEQGAAPADEGTHRHHGAHH